MCIAIPIVLGGGEISAGTAALLAAGVVGTGAVVAKYDEIAGAISSELSTADAQLHLWGAKANTLLASGFNSRRVGQRTVGRESQGVDVELPTDHSPGEVHVQLKGKGPKQKYRIDDANDLSGLPRRLRDDPWIQDKIQKGFDLLRRHQP